MIAAIYARKSTEQNGVADEQKSVARQSRGRRRVLREPSHMTIRLEAEVYETLMQEVARSGLSVSAFTRKLLAGEVTRIARIPSKNAGE